MILILSDNRDHSTNKVIDWLNYFNADWTRINETDTIRLLNIEYNDNLLSSILLSVNDQTIDLVHTSSYWYRRGWLNCLEQYNSSIFFNSSVIDFNIKDYLTCEKEELLHFIHSYLSKEKRNLNSFLRGVNKKMTYQYEAIKNGLNVPETLITTSKRELLNFYYKHNRSIITKSINESMGFVCDGYEYYTKTYAVQESDILCASSSFLPTLFQKEIKKMLELRAFYLDDLFYTMAIFSQQNEQTKLDFRNYDWSNPNRTVPYLLPEDIENNLKEFLKSIDMNCGSIDLILTTDCEYIFLEVNPVGQFGMVSFPCNYQIEKKIAVHLIKH